MSGHTIDASVLIVSLNTRDETLACLASVYAQTAKVRFEVIVVDNASSDGSADAVARYFGQAILLAQAKNLGFAQANNLAAGRAVGRYLLLLNPDTVILDGAIDRIVRFADEHSDAGVYGGRTFFADMSLNRNSCHGQPTPWSLACMGLGLSSLVRQSAWLNPEGLGRWNRDSVRSVDCITGCFLLIQRELWVQLKGFDTEFFMYGEDTDLCIRARRLGKSCMVFPDARLIHYGGRSEKCRADKMVKLFRAKSQLIEKHWQPSLAWFGVAMLKFWALTRMLGSRVMGIGKPSARIAYWQWREVWQRRAEYSG